MIIDYNLYDYRPKVLYTVNVEYNIEYKCIRNL